MENTNEIILSILKRTLVSVGVAFAVAFVLLLCSAGIALSSEAPEPLLVPLAIASLGVSSLICGIVSSKVYSVDNISDVFAGAVCGFVFVLFLFVVSVIPVSGPAELSTLHRLLAYGAVIILSSIGAFIGKKRGRRRPSYGKIPKNARKYARKR